MEYKVIEIVDNTRILINYGRNDGASVDQPVRVYSKGREVRDPETNKSLGNWNIIKDELTITEVFNKFSVCMKKIKVTTSILYPLENAFTSTHTRNEELNVDATQITNNVNPSSSPIQAGDLIEILKKV